MAILIGKEEFPAAQTTVAVKQQGAQQLECLISGTLEEVHIRVNATNQKPNVWAAIYANHLVEAVNLPGEVLGKGKIETEQTKETWYGVKLASGVKVTAGTKYWLGGLATTTVWRVMGTTSGSSVTFKQSTLETFTEPEETALWTGVTKGPIGIYGTGAEEVAPGGLAMLI